MPDRIPVRATRNGGLDFIETPTMDEVWVAALRRERDGYERYGNVQGVADVNAELARLGALEDDERPPNRKVTRR